MMFVGDSIERRIFDMGDVLKRDQRTTVHRIIESRHDKCNDTCLFRDYPVPDFVYRGCNDWINSWRACERTRIVGDFNSRRFFRSSYHLVRWIRLSFLLLLLFPISTKGAPMNLDEKRFNSLPKWINPCGFGKEDFGPDVEVVEISKEQWLAQIVTQAKTALLQAELFRDDYVKVTFNTNFHDLHMTWRNYRYDWLPTFKEIPKQLGEKLNGIFLRDLKFDDLLSDTYVNMQKYAVGLEQIVWDQEDYQLSFQKQFKETEFRLRSVLCELQMALMEQLIPLPPEATRYLMPTEFRQLSTTATYRDLRDWFIYRDYMNALEYIVHAFEYLRRKMETTTS